MKIQKTLALGAMLAGALTLSAAGCKNPAKGKTQAKTGEAKPEDQKPLKGNKVESIALTPSNTKLSWKGSKVTGSHAGNFGKFTGKIEAADSDPLKARIHFTIDMNSVTSDHPKLTGHLKSKDFFHVKKFPQAKFTSTAIAKGGAKGASHTITGNLTLHGVTKSISFPANVKIKDGEMHASSEFWINRFDFGIKYPGRKDDLIRKEVVLKIDIKAKRQQ